MTLFWCLDVSDLNHDAKSITEILKWMLAINQSRERVIQIFHFLYDIYIYIYIYRNTAGVSKSLVSLPWCSYPCVHLWFFFNILIYSSIINPHHIFIFKYLLLWLITHLFIFYFDWFMFVCNICSIIPKNICMLCSFHICLKDTSSRCFIRYWTSFNYCLSINVSQN